MVRAAPDRLVTRLDGMTDEEYHREPVSDCWNMRPRGAAQGNRACGADDARAALVAAGAHWHEGLTSADDAALDQVGRSSMPWGLDPTRPYLDICWWVNQELLHHGGEIALLRDLYRARG